MFYILYLLMSLFLVQAAKDPKHCEVCLKVMTDIHANVKELSNPKDKIAIESLIEKYCSKKNKKAGPRERKLCYYIIPIKRTISTPMSFGVPPAGICKKLDRTSAEICAVKYPIKIEANGTTNYKKMRVKQLKQILRERGVSCRGCVDKGQFVKKCESTEHLQPEL
jgi:hypothetical protein